MLSTSATIAMALPGAGHASDGRIYFIGSVASATCTVVVSKPDTSLIVNGNEGGRTLTLPAAAGALLSVGATGCDAAADTTKMAAAALVSIYFESVNYVEQGPGGIISIVYK
jgi:type 1 fimbria pilin